MTFTTRIDYLDIDGNVLFSDPVTGGVGEVKLRDCDAIDAWELTEKVVDLIRKLGPPGNYYVDSIGGNPYEPRPTKRIARKITKDLDNLVTTINALILSGDQQL
jgi:hypothetical protein